MAVDFASVLNTHRPSLAPYEDLYKHFHKNPELSNQEAKTSATVLQSLQDLARSFKTELEIKTGIGGHGLFAVCRNGEGPTVLLRADMDALPLVEKTGLEYASTVKAVMEGEGEKGVMHACGHDFHMVSLLAAVETLLSAKSTWAGTVIFLFQPAEERAAPYGAKAMVDDGLYDKDKHACPIPDVVLGQHVFPISAGIVHTGAGTVMSAADSYKVTIHGIGGHGSQPHRGVDPVVVASHAIVRLQTIVSREVPPDQMAVVTVGSIQAGHTENVISDEAILKLDIRSVTEEWRTRILASVKRIINAECEAGRCPKPPTFEKTREFPLTVNDDATTAKIAASFDAYFGDKHKGNMSNAMGSEDFSVLARAVDKPYCFWFFGGTDPKVWDEYEKEGKLNDLPINHSPYFAPVIDPTLKTGVDCLVVAALSFLGKGVEEKEVKAEEVAAPS